MFFLIILVTDVLQTHRTIIVLAVTTEHQSYVNLNWNVFLQYGLQLQKLMNNYHHYNRPWKVRVICDALFILSVSLFLASPASFLPSLSLSPPPTLRAPGHLAGLTQTTLPSVRPAWTSLPAGLAPCPWSILRWGWTQSCSKTRCPYCGRSTGTLRGYNPPEPPHSPDTTKTEWGGGHVEKRRAFPWLHGWINGEANGIGCRGRGGEEPRTHVEDTTFIGLLDCVLLHFSFLPFLSCVLGDGWAHRSDYIHYDYHQLKDTRGL